MSDVPNHYATLGLARSCTLEQIRQAYRTLARQVHPDVNGNTPDAVARTQAINAAYAVLENPIRRRAYDKELTDRERPTRPRVAPTTLAQEVALSLTELLHGTTLSVRVDDPAQPGQTEALELVIPAETAPGTRFRVARAEGVGYVNVRVKARPDFRFKVRGADLRCDLKISAQRATQGGTELLRGVTGQSVRVTIPAQVPRGEIIRVPGEGLPRPRGGRGDLLVRVLYRPVVRIERAARSRFPGR